MVLLLILAIITIILVVTVVSAVAAGGATFIILFGDVIVCIFILLWIIGRIFKKRRK